MKTIWKFKVQLEDRQTIRMPKGAKILTVQPQHIEVFIWAIVDPEESHYETRCIVVIPTGTTVEDEAMAKLDYIATVQMLDSSLVWHIFEERNL